MEIWKKVRKELYPDGGFGQTYSISNMGRLRNDKTGRILKPRKEKKGYLRYNLATKELKAHRLVAIHFLENPRNLPQVNHIDGDKRNNRVENLEWCTGEANMKHSWDIGLRTGLAGELNPMYGKVCTEERRKNISNAKANKPNFKKRKKVILIDSDNNKTIINSVNECAEFLSLDQATVSNILNGNREFKPTKGIIKIQFYKG